MEKYQDVQRDRLCQQLMNGGGDGACVEAFKSDKMLIAYKLSYLRKNTKT